MKKRTKEFKVHRNFKLDPSLNERLVSEAGKTKRTQTTIIEMALAEWFKLKRV